MIDGCVEEEEVAEREAEYELTYPCETCNLYYIDHCIYLEYGSTCRNR
jgi:hypothetical protein